jgi:hypothetical protein
MADEAWRTIHLCRGRHRSHCCIVLWGQCRRSSRATIRRAASIPLLYRIVGSDPPTERDFTSPLMLGRRPRRIERAQPEEWAGLSMFDSVERARSKAQEFPNLGRWIAAVNLDPELVVARRTFGSGHYTVWGLPATILASVMAVEPVSGE